MPYVLVKYLLNEADKKVVPSRFVQNLMKDVDQKKVYRIFFTKDEVAPEMAFDEFEIKAKFNDKLLKCLDEPQKGRGRKRKVSTKLEADGYYRGKVLIIKDSEDEIRKIMKGKRLAAVPRRFQNENTEDGQPVENKKRKTAKKTHEESEVDEDAEYYINLAKQYEKDGEDGEDENLKRKKGKTTTKTHKESEVDEDAEYYINLAKQYEKDGEDGEDENLKRKKGKTTTKTHKESEVDEDAEYYINLAKQYEKDGEDGDDENLKRKKNQADGSISSCETSDEEKEEEKKKEEKRKEEKARKDREKEKMKEKKEREQALKKEKEREKREKQENEKEKEDNIEALKKKVKMMEEQLKEAKGGSTPKRAAEGESKSLDSNEIILKHGSKIPFLRWLNINSVKPDARGDSRFIKLLVDALIDKEEQKQKTLSTLDQNKVEEIATCFLERLKKRKPDITPDELAAGMKEARLRISEKLSTVRASTKN